MRRGWLLAVVMAVLVAACGDTGTPTPTPGGSSPASTAPTASGAATSSPGDSPGASEEGSPEPSTEASAPPSDQASASPSDGASASPTVSPSPSPAATTGCTSAQLKAKVTGWSGAMGSRIAAVTITNVGTVKCKVHGTPETQLVAADGTVLIDSKTQGAAGLPHVSPSDITWTMGRLGALRTEVSASNYCGPDPAMPVTVAFILPNKLGRLVASPGPGGDVPPCFGGPGSAGTISMNGWVK